MRNIFIRHGEVKNQKDIYYANVPGYTLSENGVRQAKEAGEYLKSKNYNFEIISSPLLRARQTANIIAKIISVDVSIDSLLYEWMGPISWRGLKFDEIDQTTVPEVDEEYKDVYNRVSQLDSKHEKKIFVSHQDTIRSFTYFSLLEKDEDFSNLKPSHCEIQTVNKEDKKVVQLFKPN